MNDLDINHEDRMLDALIVQALEAPPEVAIPADFAARIVSQLPARPRASFRPRHFGLAFSWVGGIALMVALFVLSPSITRGSATAAWIELFVSAQFVCLVVWMALRTHRSFGDKT